ncbi:MAG TPA: HlyD family efflux transporter periplasmic adaptor subunit [Terrimicrobiaceae bacterium]
MAIINTPHTTEFHGRWGTRLEPATARSFVRQSIRIGAALVFLLLGAIFLYLKAFRNASLDGVVNAPKYVVRAPIEGILQFNDLSIGTPLVAGGVIAQITNDRIDDRLEAELSTEASRLTREIAAQRAIRNEIAAIRARLALRLGDLRNINLRKYDQTAGEAITRAMRLRVVAESSHQDLQRFAVLANAGVEAPVRMEEYRRAYIHDQSESETAERAASRGLIDKEAAQKGYFLGDAVWDVPYTQQRLDEIDILSLQLALRSQVLESQLAEVTERLEREKVRLAQLRHTTICSRSAAVISALFAGDGFEVLKGDALMEILDVSRTYVEATFPESTYEQLQLGATVHVRFAGSTALLRGTIVSVQGPGATDQPEADAARLRNVSKDELVLKVALEATALHRTYGPTPQVGRRAQIVFD